MFKLLNNNIQSLEIPILNSKQNLLYSLSNNNFDSQYYFKLVIKINNKYNIFMNSGNKKYSNLINYSDQIKYDQINNFEIQIKFFDNTFFLNGNIDNELSSFAKQENNIFIEFSQDTNGFTNCICYFIEDDLTILSISPPN